jgi:hypothetical protein
MNPSWDDTMRAMAARQRLLRDQVRRGPSGRRSARRPAVEISRQPPGGSPTIQPKAGCACGGGCPRCRTTAPAGLRVGPANDRFEREADRIAERIMAMPGTPARHRIAEEDSSERIRAKALPGTVSRHTGGLEAALGRSGPGKPLPAAERAFFEPRFGRDLGAVRLHDDGASATAAESISAQAFTLGSDIYLGAKAQGPRGTEGRRLLAHELTHVAQQQAMTAPNLVQRQPTFPDETCAEVRGGIEAAWPTSQRWVQVARSRLSNPSAVAGALQRHFKIDPEDPAHGADLTVVRDSFRRQEGLFDTAIFNICTPPDGDCASSTRDGGEFAARAHRGPPEWGIEHCLDSARTSFLTRRPLIETLVHEMAHLADPLCTDYAYRGTDVITSYEDMTRAQAVRNADSYSEFAHQMFLGTSVTPLVLGLSTGTLLSSGRPRWAAVLGSAALGDWRQLQHPQPKRHRGLRSGRRRPFLPCSGLDTGRAHGARHRRRRGLRRHLSRRRDPDVRRHASWRLLHGRPGRRGARPRRPHRQHRDRLGGLPVPGGHQPAAALRLPR